MIPLGNLSSTMKEALKVADAYLKAHIQPIFYADPINAAIRAMGLE